MPVALMLKFFSLLSEVQFFKGDRYGHPSVRLRICRLFHLCDFRFHGFYQLWELFLTFLSCLGMIFKLTTADYKPLTS